MALSALSTKVMGSGLDPIGIDGLGAMLCRAPVSYSVNGVSIDFTVLPSVLSMFARCIGRVAGS
jgi:hypothetical protein